MTIVLIILLVSASLALLLGIASLIKRSGPANRILAGLLFAIAWWSAGYAAELYAATQSAKIWWAKLEYIGILSVPILFLLLAIEISGHRDRFPAQFRFALWLPAFVIIALVWSNELHGWYWQGFYWSQVQGWDVLRYQYGPLFWLHSLYSYILVGLASGLLIWSALKLPHIYRQQARLILAATLFPWISNLLYLLEISPWNGLDFTPVAFMLTGLLLGISLYRFQVFHLSPIARDKLIDTMADAVIMIDAFKRIADLNPAAQNLSGFRLEQALGRPAADVLQQWPVLARYFQIDQASPTEMRIISDQQNRWYHSQINPLRTAQGNINGWLVVLRDITEQRNAQAEAARLAAVIEQAHETVVITDLHGNIQYANPHFEKTTGYSIPEALGNNPRILKSGLQNADFYRQVWEQIAAGKIWSGEFINRRKDGSFYHEAATIFPIRDSFGKIANYAAVKRDITTQVEAQTALENFSRHLANLHKIGNELAAIHSLDMICQRAIEMAHQDLGFDRISVWLVDPKDSQYCNGTYGIDEQGNLRDERKERTTLNLDGIPAASHKNTDRLYQRQNVALCDHASNVVGYGEQIIFGMSNAGQLLGYISSDNLLNQQPIPDWQRDSLVIFGQILENQINRYHAELKLRQSVTRSRLLNEITQAVIEQDDVETMLQTLADRLGELFDADGSYITLWDEKHQLTLGGAAYGPLRSTYAKAIKPQPGEPTLTSHVLKTGQPLVVADALDTPYLSRRLAEQFPTRSILALPLIALQEKLGAALISFNRIHHFAPEDVELGQQAAQQISLAVLKSRLLAEAQQRAKEAETLRQAGAAVATALELEKTIKSILEELNRVVPYDSASVQLLQGNELEIVGERGFESRSVMGYRFAINAETPNALVVQKNEPVIFADAREAFEAFRNPPHNHIRAWMGVPLKIQDRFIGMLALDQKEPGRFTPDHARLATAFAAQVTIALENARLFSETQRLAITDTLTGLYNRRHFMEMARQEFIRAGRYELPLSVIMLDIDGFKLINDTYGHLVGDQVLQVVAACCKRNIRAADLIGRFGGEEFVILLPETAPLQTADIAVTSTQDMQPESSSGVVVAERLRQAIINEVKLPELELAITISLGIAGTKPTIENVETLIDQADQALLAAKASGKNRVVVWQEKE